MIKEAFLLSAGLGTRMKPLTDTIPKPLIQLCGKPLIRWNLELLKAIGCTKVIVNVHYKKDLLIDYLLKNPIVDLEIIISEEDPILDTGGGIKKILPLIKGERFYTWNSDLFIDPRIVDTNDSPLTNLYKLSQSASNPDICLLLKECSETSLEKFTPLGFDRNLRLSRFLGHSYASDSLCSANLTDYSFLGISIMKKEISKYFPENTDIFSITKDVFPILLKATSNKEEGGIYGSPCNYYWNDVGTPERLNDASKEIGNILPLLQNPVLSDNE